MSSELKWWHYHYQIEACFRCNNTPEECICDKLDKLKIADENSRKDIKERHKKEKGMNG